MLHTFVRARRSPVALLSGAVATLCLAVTPLGSAAAQTTQSTSGGAVVQPLRVATQAMPSLGGVDESFGVWIQLPQTAAGLTDVELCVEPRPALLAVEVWPALQPGVAPGERTRFRVHLDSRACFVQGAFRLVFRDHASGAELGSIPVDIARGAGESPRDVKQAALETLGEIKGEIAAGAPGVGDPEHAIEELRDAIEELRESLEPQLWARDAFGDVDPLRLDPHEGAEVFHEERESAQEIFDAIRQGEIGDVELIAELLGVVDALVFADRELADVAIQDAQAGGGDPEEIEEALGKLAEGDALVADAAGESDLRHRAALLYSAMDGAYRHAWKAAIDALDLDSGGDSEHDSGD